MGDGKQGGDATEDDHMKHGFPARTDGWHRDHFKHSLKDPSKVQCILV